MQTVYRADELTLEDRIVVERLLGRELQTDESVEIATRNQQETTEISLQRTREAMDRILELAKGKTLGGLSVRDLIEDGQR